MEMTEAELLAQFGQSRIGPGGFLTNLWFVKEGVDNIYRIFPPMKEQVQTGRFALYHGKHWGYKIVDTNSGKEVHKHFRCPQQKNKDKSIRVECAECTNIAEKKALLETVTKGYEAEGKTAAEIVELVEPIESWLKTHNLDKKYYMNAMNEKGEYGVLAVAYTQFGNLEEVIKAFKKTDPTVEPIGALNGVWFNFTKSGKGRDTKHPVSIVTQKVEVEIGGKKKFLDETREAPLTPDQLKKALEVFKDLSLAVPALSVEKIRQLANGSGDPEEIAAIFAVQKDTGPNKAAESQTTGSVPQTAGSATGLAQTEVAKAVTKVEVKPDVKSEAPVEKAAVKTISNADFIARYGKK